MTVRDEQWNKEAQAQSAEEIIFTTAPKGKYGFKCRCSNGNDIWYEPITDEMDGWVERTPNGAIVKVTVDNRLEEK